MLGTNSKLKKDGIAKFSLPAIRSCPNAGLCKRICYAAAHEVRFPVVREARKAALKETGNNTLFHHKMTLELEKTKAKVIRVHDSGDFYSKEYMLTWLDLAGSNPDKSFYAYTKSVQWAKDLESTRPKNFKFIFSYGGKQDHLIDKRKDSFAIVLKPGQSIPKGYVDASDSDLIASNPKNRKIALHYHGAKNPHKAGFFPAKGN